MFRPYALTLVFLLSYLQQQIPSAEHGKECPCLREFVVPSYGMARQIDVQGEVKATIDLDSGCRIGQIAFDSKDDEVRGHEILTAVVKQAVEQWKFSGCSEAESQAHAIFRFVLSGDRTEEWAPTSVSISEPYTMEIRTNPPYGLSH